MRAIEGLRAADDDPDADIDQGLDDATIVVEIKSAPFLTAIGLSLPDDLREVDLQFVSEARTPDQTHGPRR